MLVMNQTGMEHLLSDKFKLGGEASAAAGPVGRDASAMTDARDACGNPDLFALARVVRWS